MKTNFQMLRDLNKEYDSMSHKRGIVTSEEINMIIEKLCLNEMNVLQLRNLRDFVVLFLSRNNDNKTPDEAWSNMDKISAITSVIDHKVFNIGGEV